MDKMREMLGRVVRKYRYVALVLLIGLVLLLLPGGKSGAQEPTAAEPAGQSDLVYAAQVEARLTQMLRQIEGAGEVEVMLTLAESSTTRYQTDIQCSNSTDESGSQRSEERKTVILSTGSAYDEAAVTAVLYPAFQGALVVCQGAQSATVRYQLVQAVAALTGLRTDRITVVKMK